MSDSEKRPAERWVAIVDDDASIRRAIARLLRDHDIPCRAFASAEEYLGRADRDEPCCLVLDVHLGRMSGFELTDRLVADGRAGPIVFISAANEIPPALLARGSGPHGYLRKPFAMPDLLALVRRHVDDESESRSA